MTSCKEHILFASLVVQLSAGSAMAAEQMDTAQLHALITGNTLYVDVAPGTPGAPDGGIAPIYYANDGAAAAQLPAGLKLIGTWAIDGDQYCIDWDNGPKNSCTKLVRTDAGFQVMDAAKNEPRGVVTRIATGNAENL